ncbi:MAG: GNAT family N-acetyltransferase [archaeon]
MEFVEEPNLKSILLRAIGRWGFAAEHNYHYFTYTNEEKDSKNFFWHNGDDKGIMGRVRKGRYEVLFPPLAPPAEHLSLWLQFLTFIFDNGAIAAEIELSPDMKQELIAKLPSVFKASKPKWYFSYPVFDMTTWDGDTLEGGKWKDVRYYWNKFNREHKLEFVDAKTFSKEDLYKIVEHWKQEKKKRHQERIWHGYFYNVINANFAGYDLARVTLVDGKPEALIAGFNIPNSKGYYSSIGIFNGSIDRLSMVCNLDELRLLKKLGYTSVDFGGSDKKLMEFKMKFKPAKIYKTHVFLIKKT